MPGAELDRRIVDAALACYSRFGVRKSTLEDIAREAGVSRATIYRYFPSKDALLRVVISQEISRILGRFQAELSSDGPLSHRLAGAILVLEEELSAHKTLHSVLELEPELLLPQLTIEGRASLAMLASLVLPALRSAAEGGEIDPSDLDEKAEWMARMTVSELGRAGLGKRFEKFKAALDWVEARLMPALVFGGEDR
jgi:AcrR family transcriptional regulator